MNRRELIENVVHKINNFPDDKIKEVNDFAEFLLSKIDDKLFQKELRN